MPKLRKRGEVWHYAFTVAGKRIRRSAETSDRTIAEDIAIRHENRLRRAAVYGEKAELSFAEAVNIYLDHKPDSRFILPLLDHFGKTKIADITPPKIRAAARELYPGRSAATWNRQVITPARAVINFAAEEGLCEHFRMKRFSEGERRKRPAGSKEWLKAFQRQARKQGLHRLAALARFMFETGARIGQACAMTWEDIDLKEGCARLVTRKTGSNGPESRERIAWLTPTLVADIANIPDRHPRTVFGYASRSTVDKVWKRVIANAAIPELSPHEAGRHGFATEMVVRNGVDVATAADRGGWASKRLMLETYVHGREDREVIDRVFGTPRRRKGNTPT